MADRLEKLKQTLIKKNFDALVCGDLKAAVSCVEEILGQCPRPLSIGVGSSETVRQLGLHEVFQNKAEKVYFHKPMITQGIDRAALTSDMYFCSANAISMDGHIVNIDGMGNRVAATCFGPKKVVYLIGRNKVVPTLDDALLRARNVAAVGIAKKHGRKTPCAATGKCTNCNAPECVCALTTIHRRKPYGTDFTIILVDEDLGI